MGKWYLGATELVAGAVFVAVLVAVLVVHLRLAAARRRLHLVLTTAPTGPAGQRADF